VVGTRRAVGTAVVAAVLSGPLALPASAPAGETNGLLSGTVAPGMARIVSPSPGAVTKGDAMAIRVRIGPRVRSVRAWLDGREVTRSLRRAGGDRVATLRAPELRMGVNHLYVRARDGRGRRDFDLVRFVRARRAKGLLGVRLDARRVRRGRVRAGVVLGRGARLRAWLNGHRLRAAALGSGSRRRLVLDGDEGLRFGRNRLSLLGFHEAGRFDLERRNLVVRRTRPIPAAGRDRRARLGHSVKFDARRSRATHPGRRLAFSWRIVRAPDGSKARIRGAHGARPRLRPDKVGTYRARLAVREVAAGRRAASVAASRRSTATVTVAAVPDIPPGGVPITVINDASGDLRLGPPVNELITPRGPGVQLYVFDRSDLRFRSDLSRAYAPDLDGMQSLAQDVSGLSAGELVSIAAPPGQGSSFQVQDPAAVGFLNKALASIGAPSPVEGSVANPPPQGFSAVGVPGLPCCEATINPGLSLAGRDGVVRTNGALKGFLRPDSSGNYTYVDGDYVPFDTVAPGTTPTEAVISVGGSSYSSGTLSPGQGGFYVLALDAGTLAKKSDGTWVVSGPGVDSTNLPNTLSEMHQVLQTYVDDPSTLVFIQSVGTVDRDAADAGAVAEWNQVRDDQTALGGHGYYLNAVDGDACDGCGSYAFVGPANAPTFLSQWAMTASPWATGSPGQLSGLLGRNPQSQFYPKIAGTQAAVDIGLPEVASAEPVPWPQRDSDHRDALACVASAMGLSMPIEDNYYSNANIQWGQLADTLKGMSADDCQEGVSAQAFEDVKDQLALEWLYVPTIQNGLIPNLQSPLLADQGGIQANFSDVVQAVQSAVTPPDSASVDANGGQIAIDVLWIASYIPAVGDAAGLLAGGMQLALDISNNDDGSPIVTDFQTAVRSLADDVVNDYQAVYDQLGAIGDVLVSDWGRLSTAARNADGDWSWDRGTDTPRARDALTTATKKLSFETLFPVVYATYRFGDQQVSEAGNYVCYQYPEGSDPFEPFNPFENEPEGGNLVVVGAGPQTDLWAFGRVDEQFLKPIPSERTTNGTPPQDLWDDAFANPSATTVQAPPLPSQLRLQLDAYVNRPVITHDQESVCLVDGVKP
jgi:hypothetical protein